MRAYLTAYFTPTFDLIIAAPRPDEAMTVPPVGQNETVTLRIRSDRAGEVHVHGYDQNVVVTAGAEVVLTFVAKTSGSIPFICTSERTPPIPTVRLFIVNWQSSK